MALPARLQAQVELDALYADQGALNTLKQDATVLARVYAEAEALRREVAILEESSSGASAKSPEDLEPEIARVERDMCAVLLSCWRPSLRR